MRKQLNQLKHQAGRNTVKHCNTRIPINSRAVDISKLKAFVDNNFPPGSALQVIFADEDDLLSAEAFLAKLPIWLKLTKLSARD
jgi:hypothetical protein